MDEARNNQYTCLHCKFKLFTVKSFYSHANRHKSEKNFRMQCFLCENTFKTFKLHKKHVRTCKKSIPENEIEEKQESTVVWQCDLCQEQIPVSEEPNLPDFDSVTTHITKHVSKKEVVCCPIPDCLASFCVYSSYRNHVNKHKVSSLISI